MANKVLCYECYFKTEGSFNLYGYEDINFNYSKENILTNFKYIYKNKLEMALNQIGLKYIDLKYYSPHAYNYEGDSLSLYLTIINKEKFKKYILTYSDLINSELSKNKSYDGYIALSVGSIEEELKKLDSPQYEIDVIVLMTILNELIFFKNFNPLDYIIYDGDSDNE